MSRITDLFQRKSSKVLNVYCTAGFPRIDSTLTVMKALQDNGADLIELGMPYSDPLADGPVIQASSNKALENGMTITVLFSQLKAMRPECNVLVVTTFGDERTVTGNHARRWNTRQRRDIGEKGAAGGDFAGEDS